MEARKNRLKVSTEKTGPCEYELNLEVAAERLVNPLRQAARRLNTRRPLSGFRPGKAPYDLVERVYGKEAIYDAMLDKIGNQLYQEALQEAQLEFLASQNRWMLFWNTKNRTFCSRIS